MKRKLSLLVASAAAATLSMNAQMYLPGCNNTGENPHYSYQKGDKEGEVKLLLDFNYPEKEYSDASGKPQVGLPRGMAFVTNNLMKLADPTGDPVIELEYNGGNNGSFSNMSNSFNTATNVSYFNTPDLFIANRTAKHTDFGADNARAWAFLADENEADKTKGQKLCLSSGNRRAMQFGFTVSMTADITSDLSFEISTALASKAAAPAVYDMLVWVTTKATNNNTYMAGDYGLLHKVLALETDLTDASLLRYRIKGLYTAGQEMKKVNVAEACGLTIDDIRGKNVMVKLFTQGGNPLAVDGVYPAVTGFPIRDFVQEAIDSREAIIAIDNITVNYKMPITYPDFSKRGDNVPPGTAETAVGNTILLDEITVPIDATEFNLDFPITLNNPVNGYEFEFLFDPGSMKYSSTRFHFKGAAADGPTIGELSNSADKYSLKWAKLIDAEGNEVTNVLYSQGDKNIRLIPIAGAPLVGAYKLRLITKFDAKSAAVAGKVYNLNLRYSNLNASNSAVALASVYLPVKITEATPSAIIDGKAAQTQIIANGNSVVVLNNEESVSITDINGRIIRTVSASEANKGIKMNAGAYIVKAGNQAQKVTLQ